MNFKKFTSENDWFTLRIPNEWEEYDDGEEGTYAFFNANKWTGNFRITFFRWTELTEPNEDKAAKYILEELNENNMARKIKLGNFDCAYYKKEIRQDNEDLVIYYWTTGKKNDLFLCSFTIDKKQEQTEENKSELQTAQKIIKSIKLK